MKHPNKNNDDCIYKKLFICYTITNYCNRNCFYCINKTFQSNKVDNNKINSKLWKLILDKLDTLNTPLCLDITGGEPLCHINILDILKYCAKLRNLEKLVLTTNGDYLTQGIFNILSKVNSQIIVSLHYPFSLKNINILKNTYQIRIPYIPKYKNLILTLNLSNSVLVMLHHKDIVYTKEDLYFIKSWNIKNNIPIDEPYIEAHTDKNKLCFSSGLNILPDGKWNTCPASNIYNSPIFLCKKEQILKQEHIICPSNDICTFYNTHSRRI